MVLSYLKDMLRSENLIVHPSKDSRHWIIGLRRGHKKTHAACLVIMMMMMMAMMNMMMMMIDDEYEYHIYNINRDDNYEEDTDG